MRNSILIACVLLICHNVNAQKLSEEEALQTAKYLVAKYPEAIVAYLDETVTITFSRSTEKDPGGIGESVAEVKEHHEIRLLNLRETANVFSEVLFVNSNVSSSGFRVSNMETKSKAAFNYFGEGIFYNDSKMQLLSINLDNFAQQISFCYNVNYSDVKYLNSVFFSKSNPTIHKTIIIEVPAWLDVELVEMNFDGFEISKSVETGLNKEKIYTYKAKNIPPIVSEDNAPNTASVFPHIYFVYKSYKGKSSETELFGSLNRLYQWYYTLIQSVDNNLTEIRPMVENLLKDKSDDVDKIKVLFYWVQDNIRYIAFENGIMGYQPAPANEVFNNRYGDCKGQANLLCQMLRIAGYDARLVWLGTKGIPYTYEKPGLAVDNHVICCLTLDGERLFLDPTEENIALFDYADRIQGRMVLIEDGEKYIIDSIPEFSNERNTEITEISLNLNDSKDALTGTLKTTINGESKIGFLTGYKNIRSDRKDEALISFLSHGRKNIEISDIRMSDLSQRENPIEIEAGINCRNQVTKLENELYISLESDYTMASLYFDSTRSNDYIFPNKLNLVSIVTFQIPPGYSLDYLPEGITSEVDGFHFDLNMIKKESSIVYTKHIYSTTTWLHKTSFKKWNKVINQLNRYYKEQIVLKKI